tara:strand:+ start:158 stop:1747 length:1590 start_codon:yes stop_codon:yes gene_type:complete
VELGTFFINILILCKKIRNIIKEINPEKIFLNSELKELVELFTDKKIQYKIYKKNKIQSKKNISIKLNLGRIPISFKITKNKYYKIKKIIESTSSLLYDVSFKLSKSKKKSIIFLEFNTELFKKIFEHMKDYDGDIILVNRRRPAIWNKKTLEIVRKNKCKIINFENFLNKNEKKELEEKSSRFFNRIQTIINNSEILNEFFTIDEISIGRLIKRSLLVKFQEQLSNSLLLIFVASKIFEKQDVRCIVSLNDIGETEKIFLDSHKKHSIILQHGFKEIRTKTRRFDKLDYVNFQDFLAVWSNKRKDELIENFGINKEKLLVVGSPRHDDYFSTKIKKMDKKNKTILIAPNPMNELNGLMNDELKIRFNRVLEKVINYLQKLDDVKIMVKLHPIQLKHNEEIKSFIQKIDKNIPIYLCSSVKDTINSADIIIVITPEFHATPTMLFESMILQKPIINFVTEDTITMFDYIENESVFTVTDQDDVDKSLERIIYDDKFQQELIENSKIYLSKNLENHNNASSEFAKILKQF